MAVKARRAMVVTRHDRVGSPLVNCFVHERVPAVGVCVVCQRGACRSCVGLEAPRLVCGVCVSRGTTLGYEYRSAAEIGGWPLVHICGGVDLVTNRPKVAKGVIAIGNIAVGGIAIGGVAVGLMTLGGLSLGLLAAVGGAALGIGLSVGGLAVGSVALGGAAFGVLYAIGGGAFGPAVIDGMRCDEAARQFVESWFGSGALPPSCQ
jgi:hypothetical protein